MPTRISPDQTPAIVSAPLTTNSADAQIAATRQDEQLLASRQAETALRHVTGQFAAAQQNAQPGEPDKLIFQTFGGEWRRDADNRVAFYRNGEAPAGTEKFDQEYYQPDPQRYPQAENKWIRLNARGAASDAPQYKNQARPDGVSDFDWQGYEWVSAESVPGDYTAEGKTVSFKDPINAQNSDTVLRRYIQQNVVGTDQWVGDVGTDERTLARARELGVKVEIEPTGATNENGETTYRVKISDEDLAKLRQVKTEWQAGRAAQAANAERARREVNQMFADQGRVLWNSAVNIAEGTINSGIDALRSQGGTRPVMHNPYDPAHVDFSGAKLRYESQMMRRNIEGKVDGDGIKAGEAIEMGVTIGAPIVVGAATAPKAAPQTLRTVRALPEVEAAPVTSSTSSPSRVYRVQGGTPPKASKFRISIGEKGEMVVANKERESLFVTFDDIGRVKVYQSKNRPGSEIISFEVDPKFVEQVRRFAVREKDVRLNPNVPIKADPTKTQSSYGLPPEWIDKLIEASRQGTGRIER